MSDFAFRIIADIKGYQAELMKIPGATEKSAFAAAQRMALTMEKGVRDAGQKAGKELRDGLESDLKEKGYEVELVWKQTKFGIGWKTSEGPAITLKRFIEFHARKRDVYLINVTGHFLVLHGGNVVCTSTGGTIQPAESSRYLRCRVKNAWRVS